VVKAAAATTAAPVLRVVPALVEVRIFQSAGIWKNIEIYNIV
jgi:hypothetical protein